MEESNNVFSEYLQSIYNHTIPKIENDLTLPELAQLVTLCQFAIHLARTLPDKTITDAMMSIHSDMAAKEALHNAMKKKPVLLKKRVEE